MVFWCCYSKRREITMRTDEEVEQLVEENLGLVGAVVNRRLRLFQRLPGGYDRDDLHSAASIRLLSPAHTSAPTRGPPFSPSALASLHPPLPPPLPITPHPH